MWLSFLFSLIGVVFGAFIAYLFATFDQSGKKFVTSILGLGGPCVIVLWFQIYGATDAITKQKAAVFFFVFFLLSFLMAFMLLIHLIKDESPSNKNGIRIRDIILGRKDYIEGYYNNRKKEIDESLNIPALEKRKAEVEEEENLLEEEREYIDDEMEKLNELGDKRLFITLPDHRRIYLDHSFMELIPSYLDDYSQCIISIKTNTRDEINRIKNKGILVDKTVLDVYLMHITSAVMAFIFQNSGLVRVHFRVYNPETNKYELFVGCEGNSAVDSMTAIPYQDSMIQKSDQCKRAIIKSLNAHATKYNGTNNNIWEDYMTYAFYNIRYNAMPILSFGISVKNKRRFKNIFYFLNYVKFENVLNSSIKQFNNKYSIEDILYKK